MTWPRTALDCLLAVVVMVGYHWLANLRRDAWRDELRRDRADRRMKRPRR